ncbi:MAG: Mth938-like domain-containing protein, partial [Pseudomonadota bacterium]
SDLPDVTPALASGVLTITSYGPGRFQIGDQRLEGAIILTPGWVEPWPKALESITANALEQACSTLPDECELVFVGLGQMPLMIDEGWRAPFRARGLAVDFMITRAAAHAYNITLAEGRPVAAFLRPI